jgi:hypothetical protein
VEERKFENVFPRVTKDESDESGTEAPRDATETALKTIRRRRRRRRRREQNDVVVSVPEEKFSHGDYR